MKAYALRRILQFIPTILIISLIMFVLLNLLPGNAALMAGDQRKAPDPRVVEQLKKEWGIDKPVHTRYLIYLKGLAKGDLGTSFLRREPVNKLVGERIWPTMRLSIAALLISVGIGIPLGFISALKRGTLIDTASMIGAVSGVSLPQFWAGLLLMYLFSVSLGWLPTSGYGNGKFVHLIMPAITLGVGYTALLARTTRAAVLEVLHKDYIRTARSKGQKESVVIRKHALPNALVPVVTIAGIQFGILLGGAVLTEIIFSIPGLGRLMVSSIEMRDYPMVQGGVLFIAVAFCLVNLGVDLLYAWLDPRIKSQYT